mgnify:CR=1 FL=1|jgi:hypothetical protein
MALFDDEIEQPSEFEAEEQKQQAAEVKQEAAPEQEAPKIPEKYAGKSLDEIIKMHQEAEKLIGRQAQEVGEVRKLADELIKQQLESKTPEPTVNETEIDFFENPQKAIQKSVETHPDVVAAKQAASEFKRMQVQQKLAQKHPDFGNIVQDAEFADWVKSSPVRIGLYAKADGEFDFDAADELLSTFKQIKGVKNRQVEEAGEETRKQNLKAAAVDVSGTGESSKKVYRRADLIRLQLTDPDRYQQLQPEIFKAYAEGRVK